MADKPISALQEVTLATGTTLDNDSYIEVSVTAPSGISSPTGKVSRKVKIQVLGELLNKKVLYANDLITTAKSIIGAINEITNNVSLGSSRSGGSLGSGLDSGGLLATIVSTRARHKSYSQQAGGYQRTKFDAFHVFNNSLFSQ